MARDRPSRYGPRGDREIARDRPSRYGARRRFLTPMQCEGQALALRGPGTISYAETGTGTISVGQPTREHETGDTP